jgi:aryl-alcohol dehydrogenase-like predicted oxidoreductase
VASRKETAFGYGCMGLNFGYGNPLPKEESIALIRQAADRGINFFDTGRSLRPIHQRADRRRGVEAHPRSGGDRHEIRLRD